jgi:hypothetical protein
LRKKAIPGVIPSGARNLSAVNAKKKRDSSLLPSLRSGQAAPRNDTFGEFLRNLR